MRTVAVGISALLLSMVMGIQAETIITAQDYAVDSDVVLESVVREIKSIPRDTVNVIGDGIKFVSDEVVTAKNGVVAAFKGASPREKAALAGELQVEKAWISSNDILFRSYKVTPDVGSELLQGDRVAPGTTVDVEDAFPGLDFPRGTSIYYRPDFNRLFVRQTLENILAIEDVLAEQHNASREQLGHQIEIETKFVEVNQSTLNELGFSWYFDSKHGGNAHIADDLSLGMGQDILATGLRTAAMAISGASNPGVLTLEKIAGSLRWSLFISALEQSDDADVLSAPRIVTRDGSTAIIQVGEEQMFPKRFRVQVQDTSPHIEHVDWNRELMGVQMEVTPELREGGLIDLSLHPKVIDVIGYDSYLITPGYVHNAIKLLDETWIQQYITIPGELFSNRPYISEVNASLPYFRVREIETQVTVADGSTVGMGGLIYDKLETFRDKVPVLGSIPLLGRLFRSEGEKSVKRNLMIFVTATQVDVNGRKNSDLVLNK